MTALSRATEALLGLGSEPRIAVLVPCYNEAVTIEAVVRDFPDNCRARRSMSMTTTRPMAPPRSASAAGAVVRRELGRARDM